MAILSGTDYPAIRAAIDVSITPNDLKDAVIGLDIYVGAAERELLDRVADAASKTGDDLKRVKAALVYLTAARLCPAVVRITSQSMTARDLSWSRETFDPEERAADLRAKAEREIAELLTPEEATIARPTMFMVAPGRRGW